MVLMRPVRLLKSATKALRNSIANTAASSANLLCETFERIFLRVLRNSNWSVASESGYSRLCCVLSQWSANRQLARNGLVGSSVRMLGNEESGKGDPVKPSDRRSNPAPDASSLNTYC